MKSAVKINKDEIIELIKGERSAVETYRQVFEKYGAKTELDELRQFSADHKKAVSTLLEEAKSYGIDTPDSSGAWGTWAKLVTGTAKVFGEESALKALKEGEEHGLKQYQEVLKMTDVPEHLKDNIKSVFIPAQREHINKIDQLMKRL